MPPPRSLHRLTPVLSALIFSGIVCYGLLAVRQYAAHSFKFTYLYWNLILAWFPLGLSLFLRGMGGEKVWKRAVFGVAGVLWVCFYPNSFYIVTDLVHLPKFGTQGIPFWYDLMVTASFAFAGVFVGSLALYLLHLGVRERFGYRAGWVFASIMLALASLGIYVGRFARWNSWEPFTHPSKLWGDVAGLVANYHEVGAFCGTFFFFSLMSYFFVVAMARLHEGEV